MKPHLPLALGLALAITPASLAAANPIQDADSAVLHAINGAHSPVADVIFGALSNEIQLVVLPVATGFAASGGQWGLPLRAAESELVAGVGALGLKFATARPRPFLTYPDIRLPRGEERLSSWPSGHAAIAFAGAAAIAIEQPAWAVPALGWAALVGYSRLYNGVHYPTDVISGAALGVGSAYLARWAFSGLNAQLGAPAAAQPVMPLRWSGSF